eukprot:1521105-Rhodomonas_salina.2
MGPDSDPSACLASWVPTACGCPAQNARLALVLAGLLAVCWAGARRCDRVHSATTTSHRVQVDPGETAADAHCPPRKSRKHDLRRQGVHHREGSRPSAMQPRDLPASASARCDGCGTLARLGGKTCEIFLSEDVTCCR